MKPMVKQALFTGAAVLVAAVAWMLLWDRTARKIPPKVFADMAFPVSLAGVVGDENGEACHQVILRQKGRPDQPLVFHRFAGRDMRTMSEAEIKAMLIEDTERDAEASGIACVTDDGRWLHQAYAQPHCNDCGGGCSSHSCPGSVTQSGCTVSGTNCFVTIICCPGCPPSCN